MIAPNGPSRSGPLLLKARDAARRFAPIRGYRQGARKVWLAILLRWRSLKRHPLRSPEHRSSTAIHLQCSQVHLHFSQLMDGQSRAMRRTLSAQSCGTTIARATGGAIHVAGQSVAASQRASEIQPTWFKKAGLELRSSRRVQQVAKSAAKNINVCSISRRVTTEERLLVQTRKSTLHAFRRHFVDRPIAALRSAARVQDASATPRQELATWSTTLDLAPALRRVNQRILLTDRHEHLLLRRARVSVERSESRAPIVPAIDRSVTPTRRRAPSDESFLELTWRRATSRGGTDGSLQTLRDESSLAATATVASPHRDSTPLAQSAPNRGTVTHNIKLDSDVLNRLTDDVIRRVEKRLQIERQRRGL